MGIGIAREPDPAPAGTTGAIRAGRMLVLLAVLLPLAVLVLAAFENRRDVLREAGERVERTVRVLHEHANKVFETQRLILDRVAGRLRTVDLRDPRTKAAFESFLASLPNDYDQVAAIAVTDADGRMAAGSHPPRDGSAVSFADRDWFRALSASGRRGTYVSRAYVGRQTGQTVFTLARRLDGPDGGFAGAVALSVDRSYFERFYREIDPDIAHAVVLIRADGEILVREPGAENTRLPASAPMLRAIATGDARPYTARSSVDGIDRIFAFRKVDPYPVYIGFGLSESGVLAAWRRNLAGYCAVAALAALALLAASLFAQRQSRQERLATARWRQAADALEAEAAERRRAEAQLRQAQKMEVVGHLTGGVAHDFNNLLTVVMGNLEMAQRHAGEAGGRAMRGIENAMEGARRAAILTQRLLAFSRQSPLAPERVDLNRLVAGMSDLFRRTLGERIAVETVLAGGLWGTLADVNQAENALLNLAVNARDAMPEGGRLTVETGNVHLDDAYASARHEVAPGPYVLVAVSDTGSGMSADLLPRVFEPFFTTKASGKGSGLGLAQVYGFLRQSGGHAAIYSEPGEGTVVKLYFPRHVPAAEEGRPGAQPAMETPTLIPGALERAPRAGLTVLVVEDDAMVRAFSVAALEEAGYEVIQAAEGPAALDLLDAHPELDLLFTDVVLAGPLDGREVADEAARRRPGLKVLYTTGYTRNAVIHHGRLEDGVPLIVKPFTAASLGRKVRAVMAGA